MIRNRVCYSYFSRARVKRRFLFCMVAVVLLFIVYMGYVKQPIVPAMSANGSEKGIQAIFVDRAILYRKILAQIIPGLNEPSEAVKVNSEQKNADDILTGFNRLDPRDPRNIFFAQIPYLGEVSSDPQSLVYYTSSESEEHETGPRITMPDQVRQGAGDNLVIIYHTHTTESFVPTSGQRFSNDLDVTVAKLGAEMAKQLQNIYNISVVHNRQIHDIPRNTSYDTALSTLNKLLETYPNASLVVDLHRDGVDRKISTVNIDGKAVGRVLFVVGSRHPLWKSNFSKANYIHEVLEEIAPGLSRGVRERPLVYNQHLHEGSLLIEVGGHENSLDEVLLTIPYLTEALARLCNS